MPSPNADPADLIAATVAAVRGPDQEAMALTRQRQDQLTKPPGSLGQLELLSVRLSGLAATCPPPIPQRPVIAVFAGDHGVHARGVTPWPREVTAQMVANFVAGGAVINCFARQIGAEVCVIDVGVLADVPDAAGLVRRKVRAGTADMTAGQAMERTEAEQAIAAGISTAADLVAAGHDCLITGDMGIANTTPAAALVAVYTGASPADVTGRGTGVDDATLDRKVAVVASALDLHQPDPADPVGVLAAVGGLEHAALAGFMLAAAAHRIPVVLDGVIAASAALAAAALAPGAVHAMVAGHLSTEPGALAALSHLGLHPLLSLDMRLGEGSGAALAVPLVQSAARLLHEVATFDSAGVSGSKE
jgi:nicotinate-nucleotide--dimethylbenzimidazole phosphoribosyltransferase